MNKAYEQFKTPTWSPIRSESISIVFCNIGSGEDDVYK